jgi:TalC/MipB family fructose-6-phosphate aldolase
MELYLDSADRREIEEAFGLGILDGLTTTPTFMHRHGIEDVDAYLLELGRIVPILQVEALGDSADEIRSEAIRQLELGLDPGRTVFKIPVSLEGIRACRRLTDEGLMVNVHLVYTLQQAYMAMHAGAAYVCPLVGRLQDQGQDALALVADAVDAVERYGYDTRVMFSSVRHVEHVRNALQLGAHTITVPFPVLVRLTENVFTSVGTDQFRLHTRMMTRTVGDVMSSINPTVRSDSELSDAIVSMTEYGFGCVTVVDDEGDLVGVFTDGDLRRLLQANGRDVLGRRMADLSYGTPISIERTARLNEADELFHRHKVDNLIVLDRGRPVGMLDIQDL